MKTGRFEGKRKHCYRTALVLIAHLALSGVGLSDCIDDDMSSFPTQDSSHLIEEDQ